MVHVLVVAVIVSLLAIGMAQILLARYTMIWRTTHSVQKKGEAKEILHRLLSHWVATQTYCTTPPNPGGSLAISCSGATTACASCTCSFGTGGQVTASGSYPNCALAIVSTP